MFRSAKSRRIGLIAYRALSDCAGKGALFVVTVFAARRLSQAAFGIFSIASTLGWILAVAADCGIQLHAARLVANRPAESAHVFERWFRVRLRTSAMVLIGLAAGLAIARPPRAEAAALLLLAAAYVTAGLIEFIYYLYRGLGRTDLESSLTVAHRLTMLACALLALSWFRSVTALAVALLVPAVAALALALRLARRLAGAASAAAEPASCEARRADPTFWTEFSEDVLPIGAGIVLSALYFRIDVFLIDRWLGHPAAGAYNAVFRLVDALRLFPAAVLAVALPSLLRAAGDRRIVPVATAATLAGVGIAVVGILASGWLVPLLYGDAYAAAAPAFRLLLLSFPLLSLNYALTHQLIGWNGQRSYLAICAAALVVNVALNLVLIPADGINGAAWATFWTEMVLTAACVWKLWELAPPRPGRVGVVTAGL